MTGRGVIRKFSMIIWCSVVQLNTSGCSYPKVDYFPITTCFEVFTFSYTQASLFLSLAGN